LGRGDRRASNTLRFLPAMTLFYRPKLFALASLLLLLAVLAPRPVHACSTVEPDRPNADVQIADETAAIVWDVKTQTEHFIRHATFTANAPDFGFLVPTPSRPALAEASPAAFDGLTQQLEPRHERHNHRYWQPTLLVFMLMQSMVGSKEEPEAATSAPGTTTAAVTVLDTQRVGRYDAVVLAASDAGALAGWLNAHGYAARPALREWLVPYVRAHWTLTAFKIAKDDPRASQARSSVTRLSFHALRPFFPYREPADQRLPGKTYPPRLLRVFFLSDAHVEGRLGQSGAAWPGQTVYSDTLPEDWRGDLARSLTLSPVQLPSTLRLTALEDRSSPRPGIDDVWFQPSAQQTPILPPPLIYDRDIPIPIPIDALLVTGLWSGWAIARRRRKQIPARRVLCIPNKRRGWNARKTRWPKNCAGRTRLSPTGWRRQTCAAGPARSRATPMMRRFS